MCAVCVSRHVPSRRKCHIATVRISTAYLCRCNKIHDKTYEAARMGFLQKQLIRNPLTKESVVGFYSLFPFSNFKFSFLIWKIVLISLDGPFNKSVIKSSSVVSKNMHAITNIV